MPAANSKQALLQRYFGYTAFREGQEPAIDALLQGRDVLSIMPTGAGKSICYQLPALCLPGMALVVSPLISLMRDQVEGLRQVGIAAGCLNSSLEDRDYRDTCREAAAGRCVLLYVAPERLLSPGFAAMAQDLSISLVAVDEAHCVSQWGQDFRPSYTRIRDFVDALPHRPPVGAFTATATPQVREDIREKLGLRDPFLQVTGFDRKNLFFEVRQPTSKRTALFEFIQQHKDQSGIVYCSTRKTVEEVHAFLTKRDIAAARYHAGLSPEERAAGQDAFLQGAVPVMVATNAFGMGIDKPDVRYVLHYNMPKDLESYYQEAGRAGRDGDSAHCLLLYGSGDVQTDQFLIRLRDESVDSSDAAYQARVARDEARLRRITAYCHTAGCLRHELLDYFGETSPTQCGHCGSCLGDSLDITIDAQKILSCVKRTGERFGAGMIADILQGADTERIRSWQLTRQTTYGLLKDLRKQAILDRIRYLISCGCLVQSVGEYPVLSLGPAAKGVLFHGERLAMRTQAKEAAPAEAYPVDEALLARLRALRGELARKQGVPAYVIFPDKTLRELCRLRPDSQAALLRVSGVGEHKAQRYGELFLEEIRAYQEAAR